MELNLTTFILEIINFLILVWILKRLFFEPVKRVIEARKEAVAKTLNDARNLRKEAEQLRSQYEGRVKEWEDEKAKARKALDDFLIEEKSKRLQQIEVSIEAERQKMRAQEQRKLTEERERLEIEAIRQSAAFSSRILERLASPELEKKLIKMALDRLPEIKNTAREASGGSCTVRTAFELELDQKKRIGEAIQSALGTLPQVSFSTDRTLIAGAEILLGANVIRANLRDELVFFSEGGSS